MGTSQSNHRLLGGTKSSNVLDMCVALIGGSRRPLTRALARKQRKQREERKKKNREYMRRQRANLTQEQREEYNKGRRHANMTQEQIKKNREYMREYNKRRRLEREREQAAADALLAISRIGERL